MVVISAEPGSLKGNSTINKTEAQIVSYGIRHLYPSSHQAVPNNMGVCFDHADSFEILTNISISFFG